MLAESGACYFLYLNDLTISYLRCRFACDLLPLRNLRLLWILADLLVPARAALLRSPLRGTAFLAFCWVGTAVGIADGLIGNDVV